MNGPIVPKIVAEAIKPGEKLAFAKALLLPCPNVRRFWDDNLFARTEPVTNNHAAHSFSRTLATVARRPVEEDSLSRILAVFVKHQEQRR